MTRREIKIGSKDSILSEMYGTDPIADTPVGPVTDTPPPAGGPVSNTGPTEVQQGTESGRTRKGSGSNRVPAGKSKQTFYISSAVADELNAAAEQLGRDLRGLMPKHAILAALMRAGIAQAGQVRAELREQLLQGLDADG